MSTTKVWTESLASVYSHQHGMSCICIRVGQVERDRPRPPQGADIYCSQRDIVQIFERCVTAEDDLRFGIDRAEENHDYDSAT